jgi:hypothetical protein
MKSNFADYILNTGHNYANIQSNLKYTQELHLTICHNEKLHSSYRSPNIVRMVKSGRLRWVKYECSQNFNR